MPLRSIAGALLLGALIASAGCEKSARQRMLAKKRIVFFCQHPNANTAVPPEFAEHAASVDVAAPMWFEIQADGNIRQINNGGDFAPYTAFCHKNRIALMPIVASFKPKEFLLDSAATERAVGQMSKLVESAGFDGLTIDIEEDGSDIRTSQPMLSLLDKIYSEMKRKGRLLCVTFNPGHWGQGWQSEEMLRRCDWAFCMFYDYSGPWNKADVTATAPYEWPSHRRDISRDANQILTPSTSPKILFGIPAYGNDAAFDPSGKCVSVAVTYVNALLAIQRQMKAPREWDSQARTPYFEYEKDGLHHRVWYEDEDSYSWRMALACQLHCAGIGIWAMGSKEGIDPALWAAIHDFRSGK